jgi:phosphoenolpyruvate carboxykinase (ATP)
MLAEKMAHHSSDAWLVNTGWTGGSASSGAKRCPLKYTRMILDAIHDGSLAKAEFETFDVFGLAIPTQVPGVPDAVLHPRKAWQGSPESFTSSLHQVAGMFKENFEKYKDEAAPETLAAGPSC